MMRLHQALKALFFVHINRTNRDPIKLKFSLMSLMHEANDSG